jgi:hypothetical protein
MRLSNGVSIRLWAPVVAGDSQASATGFVFADVTFADGGKAERNGGFSLSAVGNIELWRENGGKLLSSGKRLSLGNSGTIAVSFAGGEASGLDIAALRQKTIDFESSLPVAAASDRAFLQMEMMGAILETRLLKTGGVVTLDYSGLNPRDTYHSCWIHLVYWPDMLKTMIRELCEHQRADGKIPTQIMSVRWP